MSKRAERIKTDFDLRKERTRESKLHGGGRPHYSTKVGLFHGRAMIHFESDTVGQGQSGKLLADITSKTPYIIF